MHQEPRVGGSPAQLSGGCALSWGIETIRQRVLSSTEAEYCTAASACKEVISFHSKGFRMPFLMDNQSAIALACGPAAHHQRTKHIATKHHFCHLQLQLLLEGVVRYQHQATGVHTSDIFTKDLGKQLHKQHRDVLFGRQPMVFVHRTCVRCKDGVKNTTKNEEVRVQLAVSDLGYILNSGLADNWTWSAIWCRSPVFWSSPILIKAYLATTFQPFKSTSTLVTVWNNNQHYRERKVLCVVRVFLYG
jgi:hypothetical protein